MPTQSTEQKERLYRLIHVIRRIAYAVEDDWSIRELERIKEEIKKDGSND